MGWIKPSLHGQHIFVVNKSRFRVGGIGEDAAGIACSGNQVQANLIPADDAPTLHSMTAAKVFARNVKDENKDKGVTCHP